MPVEEQVVSIYVGTSGMLDDIDARGRTQFETGVARVLPRPPRGPARRDPRHRCDARGRRAWRTPADDFKRHFVELQAARARPAVTGQPMTTDAEAPGDPTTPETLETE